VEDRFQSDYLDFEDFNIDNYLNKNNKITLMDDEFDP